MNFRKVVIKQSTSQQEICAPQADFQVFGGWLKVWKSAFQTLVIDFPSVTKGLKIEILKAKQSYKNFFESKFAAKKFGSSWTCVKTIAGLQNPQSSSQTVLDDFNSNRDFANSLNMLHALVLLIFARIFWNWNRNWKTLSTLSLNSAMTKRPFIQLMWTRARFLIILVAT